MTRIKVLSRNAVFAWNPKSVQPLSFVAGTSAQQFDASFSSAAALDICVPDLKESVVELSPKSSADVEHRFHKIIWTDFSQPGSGSKGIIIGGSDNGIISFYDAERLMSGQGGASKISQSQSHTGHVLSLDSNPFQPKLIASGASVSEVFIWDLHQPSTPMSPGPKEQPLDHVVCVQWNKKVEHILGSLTPGKALLWDLRKGDGPILSLGDLGARSQWKQLCWHPEEATSLCLASEDDHFPVVQTWDVRYASAPLVQMEGHQKGILSMDWCHADPDLLVTCSKDMRVYLWNPNTGAFLAEIPYAARNWSNQVTWCPGNPNLIGSASVDSRVTLYSLVGGRGLAGESGASPVPSPKLAESFPGADFSASGHHHHLNAAASLQQQESDIKLPQVPRWLRPGPCGARFCFGNRLISFDKGVQVDAGQTDPAAAQRLVNVSQVFMNETVKNRAEELESAFSSGNVSELCDRREQAARSEEEKTLWKFLKAHCEGAGRKDYAVAIGIDTEECRRKYREILGGEETWKIGKSIVREDSVENGEENSETGDSEENQSENSAPTENNLLNESHASYLSEGTLAAARQPLPLPTDLNSFGGMLTEAMVNGDISAAVEMCVRQGEWADAFQLSISGGSDVFHRLQKRYCAEMAKQSRSSSRLVALLTGQYWKELIQQADLVHWRQIMGLMLNFAPGDKFVKLAEQLIERMRTEGSLSEKKYVCLPCVAAGDVEALVSAVSQQKSAAGKDADVIDAVEKASVLRWSLGGGSQRVTKAGPEFCSLLRKYAQLLVNEGCLQNALNLINSLPDAQTNNEELEWLKDRLSGSCLVRRGSKPFQTVNIVPFGVKRIPQMPRHLQPENGQRSRQNSLSNPFGPQTPTQRQFPGIPPPQQMQQNQLPPSSVSSGYSPMGMYQQHKQQSSMQQSYGGMMMQQQTPGALPPLSLPPTGGAVSAPTAHAIHNVKHTRERYPSYASDGVSYPSHQLPQSPNSQQMGPPDGGYQWQAHQNGNVAYNSNAYGQGQQQNQGRAPPPVAAVPPRPAADRPWNDPPHLSPKQKEPSVPKDTPAPLTQPVPGAVPCDQYQGGFMPVQPLPPVGVVGGSFGGSVGSSVQHSPSEVSAKEEELRDVPMPSEHKVVEDVLERIADMCLAQKPTTVMKRRVEESRHKIEAELYSRLKKQVLSQSSLASIHHLVGFVQNRDYHSALAIHTQMAQSYDFAQISTFMPALKALLQTAAQMGVYYA